MKYRVTFVGSAMMLALAGVFAAGSAAFSPMSVRAAEAQRQTSFSIKNMTCALCPVTVRAAMQNVKGVNSVKIDFEAKTATVVYDPAVTTPDAIAAASTDAGYPGSAIGS